MRHATHVFLLCRQKTSGAGHAHITGRRAFFLSLGSSEIAMLLPRVEGQRGDVALSESFTLFAEL